MRLVTFNVLHGASPADGVVDLGRFARAIVALDPDVLALQEVDRGQERSLGADLAQVAAEAMGAATTRFVAAMTGDPRGRWQPASRTLDPGAAAYGVALLSRYPLVGWRDLHLPRIVPRVPRVRRDPRRVELVHEELRTAVVARLDTPEGPLLVANAHLSFFPGWNRLQLYALRRALTSGSAARTPAVLMGDLNMTPRPVRAVTRFRPLVRAETFPHDAPKFQIDHVLAHGDVGRVVDARAVELPMSDHRALVVELDRSRLAR
ncbi:MAG: endonuclease/exonuclease/phosphatase family protein [Janthinobacterium lividum]